MSKFTSPLVVEYIDGTNWKLYEEFEFYLSVKKDEIIKVPKGYVTDFASVPHLLKIFAKNNELFNKASVLHDYLYSTLCLYDYNRKQVDDIFLDAMRVFGMTKSRSMIFYKMVRWFGKSRYRKSV